MILESRLHELLTRLITRFGGAIEFWTVVCLSGEDLGQPDRFIDEQWSELNSDIQLLRMSLAEGENATPIVQEQVMKLMKTSTDLREVFDVFLDCTSVSLHDLELAVVRLGSIWHDVRMRIVFLSAIVSLSSPLPRLTSEQEVYYQLILDTLFDKLAARQSSFFQHQSESSSN